MTTEAQAQLNRKIAKAISRRDSQWCQAFHDSKPRVVKDDWSSCCHRFGRNMNCDRCGISWGTHQSNPRLCPKSLVYPLLYGEAAK